MQTKRHRGAQPGNRNAVKHGFYCRALGEEERSLFNAAAGMQGIDEEVALLRCEIRKAFAGGDVRHLAPLARVIFALEKLIRTRQKFFVDEKQNRLETAMRNVYRNVMLPLFGEDTMKQIAHDRFPDEYPPDSTGNDNQ